MFARSVLRVPSIRDTSAPSTLAGGRAAPRTTAESLTRHFLPAETHSIMPDKVGGGVNSQGNSYTTYSNGGYSVLERAGAVEPGQGSHYYSPSGGNSGLLHAERR